MWWTASTEAREVFIFKRKPFYAKASKGEGGAGGSRTLVQTRNRNAFYMLILLLVVGNGPGRGTQYQTLFPLSHLEAGTSSKPA